MGLLKSMGGLIGGGVGFLVGGPVGAAIGASIGGGISSASAAGDAAKAQGKASDAAIAEQRAARADFNARTQSFVDTGTAGSQALQSFLGLSANPEFTNINSDIDAQIKAIQEEKFDLSGVSLGGGHKAFGRVATNVKEFELDRQARIQALESQRGERLTGVEQFTQGDRMQGLDEINPVVDFLRNEGFEQIQESAAAGGRLGSGGTLKDLTQFNTDLTSTIIPQLQNQRFNQLFNTASLGANAAAGQGNAALSTASNVGNLLGQKGQSQAQGAINQSNAFNNAASNVLGAVGAFPGVFNSGGTTPPPTGGTLATSTDISNALSGAF